MKNITSAAAPVLPDGKEFVFWEKEPVFEREYHVDGRNKLASDENDGSEERPFRTINRAAEIAEPGTRIIVHPGLYRECVTPKKGGESPERMISYEAIPGVTVSGSVIAKNIVPAEHCAHDSRIRLWTIKPDPADFPGYNPFCANNLIHMRLFLELTKENQKNHLARRGVVFVDGRPLEQVEKLEDLDGIAGSYFVESNGMTIHCRPFEDMDLREHLVELTAKEQNFAPDEPYLGYIRVKGFHFTHAATGHPFPQRGAVSTYRGNHWIIEDNVIEWSNCLGMDVGNEDPCFSTEGLPLENIPGWTIVRRNEIRNCGVCGLAGYIANEILVEDNLVSGCGWLMTWHPSESGGIKFHCAKRCLIRRNIVEKLRCGNPIWLDCDNDYNRITQNLVINNEDPDPRAIHIECTRDCPNMIDHNIIWDFRRLGPPPADDWLHETDRKCWTGAIMSMGSDDVWAYNNLIGRCPVGVNLNAVYMRFRNGRGGTARAARIMNNLFYDCGEAAIRFEDPNNESDGNLFASMSPGYMVIHYPMPPKFLNLTAWQRFFGMDLHSADACFEIHVDEECYELTFLPAAPERGNKCGDPAAKIHPSINPVVRSAADLPPVLTEKLACVDYFGNQRDARSLPGPFASIEEGVVIRIDPRRKPER